MLSRPITRTTAIIAIVLVFTAIGAKAQFTFGTLDDPLGVHGTFATGVSGNDIVGTYIDSNLVSHGFLYDGDAFSTLDYPNAIGTHPMGIFGNDIVGYYIDAGLGQHGFLYNGSAYMTLDYPIAGPRSSLAAGIWGATIVGGFSGSSGSHGFRYDGTSFTSLDYPGASFTSASGVFGTQIVGWYADSATHGFLYDGQTWVALNVPFATTTLARSIFGNNIVGSYDDNGGRSHGFLFDGTGYTTVDYPGATLTIASGTSGNEIVGYYTAGAQTHGFIAIVPEHSTALLIVLGAASLTMFSFRKKRRSGASDTT